MNAIKYSTLQELFEAALREADPQKLRGLVTEVEGAIFAGIFALDTNPNDCEEQKALRDACERLLVVRTKILKWRDPFRDRVRSRTPVDEGRAAASGRSSVMDRSEYGTSSVPEPHMSGLCVHHALNCTVGNPSYSQRVNSTSPIAPVFGSRTGLKAVGIFLFFGAVMAFLAGITLVGRGTALDRIWALNPRAYNELSPLGKPMGLLFLLLAAALAIAGTGWLKRTRWGWRLAVVIIGMQVLGDVTNIFYGHIIQGVVGVTIAGTLLLYMTRPSIRACFVTIPKQIVHSHDP